ELFAYRFRCRRPASDRIARIAWPCIQPQCPLRAVRCRGLRADRRRENARGLESAPDRLFERRQWPQEKDARKQLPAIASAGVTPDPHKHRKPKLWQQKGKPALACAMHLGKEK